MFAKYMLGTFFKFNVNDAKLAAFGDTLATKTKLFSLGLMTNHCAPNFTQDIKSCAPLLSLFGVPPKNHLPSLQAFVMSVL